MSFNLVMSTILKTDMFCRVEILFDLLNQPPLYLYIHAFISYLMEYHATLLKRTRLQITHWLFYPGSCPLGLQTRRSFDTGECNPQSSQAHSNDPLCQRSNLHTRHQSFLDYQSDDNLNTATISPNPMVKRSITVPRSIIVLC